MYFVALVLSPFVVSGVFIVYTLRLEGCKHEPVNYQEIYPETRHLGNREFWAHVERKKFEASRRA